jgi:transcriptional regulator with XRE-family HTH domain
MTNRIRELRESRGLTQQQLADKIGTTKQQVGRLEKSKRRLNERWLRLISDALRYPISDLLGETEPSAEALVAVVSPAARHLTQAGPPEPDWDLLETARTEARRLAEDLPLSAREQAIFRAQVERRLYKLLAAQRRQ